MIPCKDCLVLAICKSKDHVECDLLYEYMYNNIEYDDTPGGGFMIPTDEGLRVWAEVESYFQREFLQVTVCSDVPTRPGFYAVSSKDLKAARKSEVEWKDI